MYLYNGYAGQATIILFGNLLNVSLHDLKLILWLTLGSLAVLSLFTKQLLFASLEPELAAAKGLAVNKLAILFMMILSIAITLASQVVGIILVFTLLIGPAAIAMQWAYRFWTGLGLSVLLSLCTVWLGLSLSYWTNWPISFWITTIVFVVYLTTHLSRAW